ncbi:hypothetical protein MMC25_005108 [Agyrium rufum]|nr:hypothetical protein [Agyrium rufum]
MKNLLHRHRSSSASTKRDVPQQQVEVTGSTPGIPDIERFGLTPVHVPDPPESALVDVVFVHGLNGKPQHTWTAEASNKQVFWPSQLLPQYLQQARARVMVFGYDADVAVVGGQGVTKERVHQHAEGFLEDLAADRQLNHAETRPLIFVAHSLGGIVVKRALIISNGNTGEKTAHLRSVFVSTYGILFFGTPHLGADVAQWGSYLEMFLSAVVPKKAIDTSPELLNALKKDSEILVTIDDDFAKLMIWYSIFYFYEAKPTDFKGTLRYVVSMESAAPTRQDVERAGIQADHSHMCKFTSASAPGFSKAVSALQRFAEAAPPIISQRWEAEMERQKMSRLLKAKELYPEAMARTPSDSASLASPTQSNSFLDTKPAENAPDPALLSSGHSDIISTASKASEPYFIVPPGFHPNSFFVGMEKELKALDKIFFEQKKRREGTACALIHGQAGSGKTHLAREYVTKNRSRFSGGIFWFNARLKDELLGEYWQVAQKVIAKDQPDLRISGPDTVEVVRRWFEGRSDWLIVLDGVTIDNEDEARELSNFIPNSKNCCLLFVSMAQRLENMHRLLRPTAVRVPNLSSRDARKLLLKEIGYSKPTEAQKRRAEELVKQVGGLPLAINAISHRIADTHEPLETFKIHSISADPRLGGPYHSIMRELTEKNHEEAYNLIHILCFFGPHIPVMLVQLGLKAPLLSKVDLKSNEGTGKPDINFTYGTLIKYALIERNRPSDSDSVSSSRDSLVEPEPIDLVKIHTVVQNFCIDELRSKKEIPQWLALAIALFCRSFQQADFIIKQTPGPARVSDYRAYLVHGEYLSRHVAKHESKAQLLSLMHAQLLNMMTLIRKEIQEREPGSSRESVRSLRFQVSIFDRTYSSDSSGESLEESIKSSSDPHRPEPLSLERSKYILGEDVAQGSPLSINTGSPGTVVVDHSPKVENSMPFELDQDFDGIPRAVAMEKTNSDNTARPPSSGSETHLSGAENVDPKPRPKRWSFRSSFRDSASKLSRTEIDGHEARDTTSTVNSSAHLMQPPTAPINIDRTSSSNNSSSLAAGRSSSASPSRSSISSFFKRGSSPRSESPSWAAVAAGKFKRATSSRAPSSSPLQTAATPVTTHSRGLSGQATRPVTANLIRNESAWTGGSDSRPTSQLISSVPSLDPPLPPSSGTIPINPPNMVDPQHTFDQDSQAANSDHRQALGPNLAPLPVISDIEITMRRPSTATVPLAEVIFDPTRHHAYVVPFQQMPDETRYSPPVDPVLPYPLPYPDTARAIDVFHSQHSSPNQLSPKESTPNSSTHNSPPPMKSSPVYVAPRTARSEEYNTNHPDNFRTINSASVAQTAAGWQTIYSPSKNAFDPSDANQHPPIFTMPSSNDSGIDYGTPTDFSDHLSMSRGSSGPGIALLDDEGYGLGIVPFGRDGEVRFGEMDEPVSIREAQARNRQREERLKVLKEDSSNAELAKMARSLERQKIQASVDAYGSGARGSSGGSPRVPYPENDIMPDSSAASLQELPTKVTAEKSIKLGN